MKLGTEDVLLFRDKEPQKSNETGAFPPVSVPEA